MEDDEEILSHTSHDSQEPPQQQQQVLQEVDGDEEEEDEEEDEEERGIEIEIPNSDSKSNSNLNQSPPSGRITVTVAAAPPPPVSSSLALVPMASPANTPSTPLAIALPIQNPAGRPPGAVGGSGGGREDCWSEGATSVLIDAWGERYMELSRGNLKQKHWKEVADIVNSKADYGKTPKTDIQCKNRIDTVKKKYKTEKTKVSTGCGPSRWPFYDRLERLIGPTANSAVKTPGVAVPVPTASVSTGINNHKAVPVGIPVGVRQPLSLPFPPYSSPHLHRPPHLQSPPQQPQQQQPIRHFPSPISQQQRFRANLNDNVVGRHQLLLHQQHQQQQQQQYLQQQQQQQQQYRRGPMMAHPPPVDSDSEQEGWSNDSEDSLPPSLGYDRRKRPGSGSGMRVSSSGVKKGKGKKALKLWGNSVRELTRAILKFGEAYETAESAKLQHIMEMEKQRMKFAKELELQRMKFLMKTQLELSQFNGGNGNGNGNSDSRGGASSGRRGGNGGGGESNHMHQLNHHSENHLNNNSNNHANSDSSN